MKSNDMGGRQSRVAAVRARNSPDRFLKIVLVGVLVVKDRITQFRPHFQGSHTRLRALAAVALEIRHGFARRADPMRMLP